jgi:hypothetical protein
MLSPSRKPQPRTDRRRRSPTTRQRHSARRRLTPRVTRQHGPTWRRGGGWPGRISSAARSARPAQIRDQSRVPVWKLGRRLARA